MPSLTVIAKGQITLNRDLLRHMGIRPGELIACEEPRNGELRLRAVLNNDPGQSAAARALLKDASLIAVALPCLCELVWVPRRGAKRSRDGVATAVRRLMNAGNVVMNRPAVELGPAVFEAGGDFADGVIAYEGAWLGGEALVSFDAEAVARIAGLGGAARVLT